VAPYRLLRNASSSQRRGRAIPVLDDEAGKGVGAIVTKTEAGQGTTFIMRVPIAGRSSGEALVA
jgi:hypothetical protein